MTIPRFLIATAVLAASAATPPACAQLLTAIVPAIRFASVSEYSEPGGRIVHESGPLPGIGAMLEYHAGLWEAFASVDIFKADIDYNGRVQNGRPYNSETGTRMSLAQLGIRYRLLDRTQIVTAMQYDEWKRDIKGDGAVFGLREHTRSIRLLLGLEQAWQMTDLGQISAGVSVVHAYPERLNIQFSGLLDEVSMRTRSANGFALAVKYHPESAPNLVAGIQFDYMMTPRSALHPVTRNGVPAGQVTQPEHARQNLTLFVRYLF